LFGADVAVATTGYAEPSVELKVAHPFAWWAVAQRAGTKFTVRSGRVEFPGATRTEAQERVAAAAIAAMVAFLRETRG
jgi:nicotinamide-nucleotide amidase